MRANSAVPPGLESFVPLFPALKRWAKLGRPSGAGFSSGIEYSDDSLRPGSNNWVVSGQHTVSGKPLLSNDMHLDHQMPNLWFEAHLKTTTATTTETKPGNFDVAGVTLPGVPFVIVGHNQHIGWGFTNVGPTVEDDFIEEFNAQGQYKTPAGWLDAQHRQETIHVKGKPDVTLDVVTTRHGPIITELLPGETRKIVVGWLTGGLNHHIVHHLCPFVCHTHYASLTRIVKETAEEFGVPYRQHPTMRQAIKHHLLLLKQLGNPDQFSST